MTQKDLPPEIQQALQNPLEEGENTSDSDELDIGKYARLKRLKQDDSNKLLIEGESIGKKINNLFRLTIGVHLTFANVSKNS